MFFISDAHAQTAAPAAHAAGEGASPLSALTGMWPLVILFVVFFFLMIRPQMKRQKEHNAMLAALSKGDEVVTSGGLLGKVTHLADTSITLQIANDVEVQVQRNAVVQVLPSGTVKNKS